MRILKKIMLVGSVGVGKTTLTQRLKGMEIEYYKTQAVQYYDSIIDTPGEFLQHRRLYNALSVTSASADIIGLLVAANHSMQTFPEGFVSLFTKPVIGIITKIDLANDDNDIERATSELEAAGVTKIFEISAFNNQGIDTLQTFLLQ